MLNKTLLVRIALPLIFFLFILWIIFLAGSANYNYAFFMVGSIPYGDKIAHALLYGVMALLLNFGLGFKTKQFLGLNIQLGSILVLLFAGVEELSQYFFPSRTLDMYDFIADFVGVFLASYVSNWFKKV